MEIAEHIEALQRDGNLLGDAAQRAGLDAAVPSCPPWRVADLLRHIGYVHRWAAGFVVERRERPLPGRPREAELLGGGPTDGELLDWYRAGHATLVGALRDADSELSCWTFLDAPSPRAFWARRQAHETAMHRVDAELASGEPTAFSAEFAADGIDELIMGFFGRDYRQLTEEQRAGRRQSLLVQATDTGRRWLAELTEDGKLAVSVRRGGGPADGTLSAAADSASSAAADCTLSGPAQGVYLVLWNRLEPTAVGVQVAGDGAVYQAWRDGMRVTWE